MTARIFSVIFAVWITALGCESAAQRYDYIAVVVNRIDELDKFTEYAFPIRIELKEFVNTMPHFGMDMPPQYNISAALGLTDIDPFPQYLMIKKTPGASFVINRVRLQKSPARANLPSGKIVAYFVTTETRTDAYGQVKYNFKRGRMQ